MTGWDAILLAGGRARRLGGIDKTGLRFDGRTLLEHALAATGPARHRVVVGLPETVPTPPGVLRTVESPRWGGPVAAVAAGLDVLPPGGSGLVTILAADQPRVGAALSAVLAAAVPAASRGPRTDCWVAVDEEARPQPLLAVYRADALRAAVARSQPVSGRAMRELLAGLALAEVPLAAKLCRDIDTPADAVALGIALPAEVPAKAAAPLTEGERSMTEPSELDDWATALAIALRVEDVDLDVGLILDVARDAAHAVARPAAPLTTFLVGFAAARRGGSAADIREAAAEAIRLAGDRTP